MLTGLRLLNFKAFADQHVPLRGLTLLSGLNSSGKSTVLQALALLRQSFDANELRPGAPHSGFLLNGDLVELGVGRDVRHEAWRRTDVVPGGIGITLENNKQRWEWLAEYGTEEDLLPLAVAPKGELGLHDLFRPGFQYLRADRLNPAVSYPRSHDIAIRRGFLGARGEHTVNFLRHRQDDDVEFPVLHHPKAVSGSLLRQTEAWLGHLCPGVNLVAAGIEGTDSVRLAYRFGTAGLSSTNDYRPTNVGFGLTYVLPIIVACLTARPGSLLLLENPEAHLHPRGQSVMAELVARAVRAGAQVIVESHSDHVLNGVRIAVKKQLLRPDDVRLLYFRTARDMKKVDVPEIGPEGTISRWPEGFFDEWDRALDELID